MKYKIKVQEPKDYSTLEEVIVDKSEIDNVIQLLKKKWPDKVLNFVCWKDQRTLKEE